MLPQRIPSASEGSPRSATEGWFRCPNSVIENQALLTPAELALVLIVCRRGYGQPVSDKHWSDWTGKDPKMKTRAIRGLKGKGLHISGRGGKARYSFERNDWDRFVEQRSRSEKARTAGRAKSVPASQGMQIHPECRSRGCQKLCDEGPTTQPTIIPISIVPATKHGTPVSQTAQLKPESPPGDFPQALAAVQRHFPHVGPEFIKKLKLACEVKAKVFTDEQLAIAIQKAHKRHQQSEGLYLHTVPGRLGVVVAESNQQGVRMLPVPSEVVSGLREISQHLTANGQGAEALEIMEFSGGTLQRWGLQKIGGPFSRDVLQKRILEFIANPVNQEIAQESNGKVSLAQLAVCAVHDYLTEIGFVLARAQWA